MRVAILSPGDMGHAVGAVLRQSGAQVSTCLAGRSERTRALARKAGIADVPDLEELAGLADVILSITAPAQAADVATRLAAAVRATNATPVVVDCNAVAPETVQALERRFADTRAPFVDGSIIGPPPTAPHTTRVYVSGQAARHVEELRRHGLEIRTVGPDIGQASALKMSYAAITKGTAALATQLLLAAQHHGVYEPLIDEFAGSVPQLLAFMQRQVPAMPPKARRWVGEMEEIARTFAAAGLPAATFSGAAETFGLVGETDLAGETPESRDPSRSMDDVVALLWKQTRRG
jgi:3-hydroxyisobutyrate dehydrogenase-like beta-hydroxyacid dehydrogenase